MKLVFTSSYVVGVILFIIEDEFIHNHVINAAESLSFRPIKEEVRNKLLDLFKNGYLHFSALYTLKDELHLGTRDEQELVELLTDRATNPDYNLVYHIFRQYCNITLDEIKTDYKNSGSYLCIAFNNFAEQYHQAAHVKSSSMICVQVESIKRQKSERFGSRKQKLPVVSKEKENSDPHIILF
ncbi:33923_t:CDS:2 [Racocetra persica]|uniref:33923_t:CDS:1 n=1 Tax=Racocetra persica TaxID=160502 RepID=A0ACA9KJM6_9GLOM|nr:33923_t:CDS:2 [Racocetra persica]